MSNKFELRVDNFVRKRLEKEGVIFGEQHDLPTSIKEALSKASKSGDEFGKPDFVIMFKDYPDTCVLIEDKYGLKFLKNEGKNGLLMNKSAIENYAFNGAVHYANCVLDNDDAKYEFHNVYALGVAGEGPEDNLELKYKCKLFRKGVDIIKDIKFKDFSYFNNTNFPNNKKNDELTEDEKHAILEKSLISLNKKAKDLNKLMNDNAITVANRIIYVSGCLLAGENGLKIQDLKGSDKKYERDGEIIYNAIKANLANKPWINEDKREMMLSQFNMLNVDKDNDVPRKSRSNCLVII